jgi:hypothetical protein
MKHLQEENDKLQTQCLILENANVMTRDELGIKNAEAKGYRDRISQLQYEESRVQRAETDKIQQPRREELWKQALQRSSLQVSAS